MKIHNYFTLISLGCPKNRVDSEKILHTMLAAGYEHTQDQEKAQVILINTCSFIQPAVEESISAILDSASINPNAFLVVAGCMPLRYGQKLDDAIPEVDLFISPNQIDQIAELIQAGGARKKIPETQNTPAIKSCNDQYEFKRALSTPGYAYLRISDGCDHACKFCAIPLIRGKLKSESLENLEREANELACLGVKELILVAQDLTSYGRDLGLKNGLVGLLKKLENVSGIDWIRLMYLYPSGIKDDLIDIIRESQKILPYLDIPIQHISDKVLKSMGRPWSGTQTKELIDSIRFKIPKIVIRTTVMVGFPTETESDFDELKTFITEFELDHVGVFTYFKEEDTPAQKFGDPIPKKIKNARSRVLRSIHSVYLKRANKNRIGQIEPAIIEGFSEETELLLQGRMWDQAPEIDGKLYITAGNGAVGDIKNVLITKTRGCDLFGEIQ
ncbi:MAG: 30S ribosomal protein S12 methylthiotransferase RimO [Desulfomonilaceae bacterium]